MSQKTSEGWKYYKITQTDKAQCDFCKKTHSYKNSSTSNLKKHLQRHPGIIGISVVPDQQVEERRPASDARNAADQLFRRNVTPRRPAAADDGGSEPDNDGHLDGAAGAAGVDDDDDDVVLVTRPPTSAEPAGESGAAPDLRPASSQTKKQTTLAFSQPKLSSIQKRKFDMLVLKMIVQDLQPFSVVEDKGFSELVAALCPKYKLPCRTTLSRQYLPSVYADMLTAANNLLASADYVTLTADIWTSRTTHAYMAITAHFIDNDWTMQTVLMGCVSISGAHTAARIRDELVKVFFLLYNNIYASINTQSNVS